MNNFNNTKVRNRWGCTEEFSFISFVLTREIVMNSPEKCTRVIEQKFDWDRVDFRQAPFPLNTQRARILGTIGAHVCKCD